MNTEQQASRSTQRTEKYNGLLQKSTISRMRNLQTVVYSMVNSRIMAPQIMVEIMNVWRILSFLFPSFLAGAGKIWNYSSRIGQTVSILSYIVTFGTPESRMRTIGPFAIIVLCILAVFLIVDGAAIYRFQTNGYIPKSMMNYIHVMIFYAFFLIMPAGLCYFSNFLCDIMIGRFRATLKNIVYLILTFVGSMFSMYQFTGFLSVSLTFSPFHMTSYNYQTASLMVYATAVVNLLSGFAAKLPGYYGLSLTILMILCYMVFDRIIHRNHSFIERWVAVGVSGCSWASAASLVCCIYMKYKSKETGWYNVIIMFGFFILAALFTMFVSRKMSIERIRILDEYLDDRTIIESVTKAEKANSMVIEGFINAHPAVFTDELMSDLLEKFPMSSDIVTTFIRFYSIYPEKKAKIAWLVNHVKVNKIKDKRLKSILLQVEEVSHSRENNMLPDLKSKLQRFDKLVQNVRHKTRNFWDLALQYHLAEIESATMQLYKTRKRVDGEFEKLQQEYLNNRFVASAYLRYTRDIVGDMDKLDEWTEKYKLLQRNVSINRDYTQVCGLRMFPSLPSTRNTLIGTTYGSNNSDMDSKTDDLDFGESQSSDQQRLIHDMIVGFRFPFITKFRVLHIIIPLIVIAIPVWLECSYASNLMTHEYKELEFLYYALLMRSENYQMMTVITHYSLEKTRGVRAPDYSKFDLSSYGGKGDTLEIIKYLNAKLQSSYEKVIKLREISSYNGYTMSAVTSTFSPVKELKLFYPNEEKPLQRVAPIIDVYADMVLQVASMIETDPAGWIDNPTALNCIHNAKAMSDLTEEISNMIMNSLNYHYKENRKISIIFLASSISAGVIIILAYTIYLIVEGNRIKNDVYISIFSLPKNEISKVVDMLKGSTVDSSESNANIHMEDEELTKQQDNFIKILNTSDTNTGISLTSLWIPNAVFEVIFVIAVAVIAFTTLLDIASVYQDQITIIVSVSDTSSFTFAALFQTQTALLKEYNPSSRAPTIKEITDLIPVYISKSGSAIKSMLFGTADGDEACTTFEETAEQYDTKLDYEADDPMGGVSITSLVMTINQIISKYSSGLVAGRQSALVPLDDDIFYSYEYSAFKVYPFFLKPSLDKVLPSVTEELNTLLKQTLIKGIVVVVLIFIEIFVSIYESKYFSISIRFVLTLLEKVDPAAILENNKLCKILASDFSKMKVDVTERNEDYYKEIVETLTDCIVVTSEKGVILSTNKEFITKFGVSPSIVGTTINEFFMCEEFGGTGDNFKLESTEEQPMVFNREMNFAVYSNQIGQNYVVTIRENTQIVRFNRLIMEERQKSDKMLCSILPANLAALVQAGEKNVSFSVKSATILFLDIVSFTPWCGSNDAGTVMKTLNMMFSGLDEAISKYETLTKIKGIGDCYMAAGGIFMENNQPSQHAKEMVQFGIDAIHVLENINKELGTSLRIRVGINTGGPIVGGVIGVSKPTFEILGRPIPMAQQMEQHGVPMMVHISRSVYELIYGSDFDVKERGEIEIKTGHVVTYLVTPH